MLKLVLFVLLALNMQAAIIGYTCGNGSVATRYGDTVNLNTSIQTLDTLLQALD